MSTYTWTNTWNMSSDAGFRAIGSAISTALQNVAPTILAITTDTGQINWSTVTRAATNTSAGYEIYNFTDSLGTLYYRFDYGTGNTAGTNFGLWVTIGTGSDGAGTITGVIQAKTGISQELGASVSRTSTALSYPSYACCVDGAFWFILGVGAATYSSTQIASCFAVCIARTCDSSGSSTGDGFEYVMMGNVGGWRTSSVVYGAIGVASGYSVTSGIGGAYWPYQSTGSNYGSGGNTIYQVLRHDIPVPQIMTSALIGSHIAAEVGTATTATLALVGSTNHTFFFTGPAVTGAAGDSTTHLYGWALVYE